MAEITKACSLTETEIKTLIQHHGLYAGSEPEVRIERMSYLNKRLKAFNEVEIAKEAQPENGTNDELKKDGW